MTDSQPTARLVVGDALTQLREMADGSVHCVVTSPPYFNLRRYGAGPQELGSEATLDEYIANQVAVFAEVRRVLRDDGVCWVNVGDTYLNERTGGNGATGGRDKSTLQSRMPPMNTTPVKKPPLPEGVSAGNLAGVPERLALALQSDGWVWRQTVIWEKESPMPESVSGWAWEPHRVKISKGRVARHGIERGNGHVDESNVSEREDGSQWAPCPGCPVCAPDDGLVLRKGSWRATRSHELLLMLTKGMGYYADQEAVKEPAVQGWNGAHFGDERDLEVFDGIGRGPRDEQSTTRNPRSVQRFSRAGSPEAEGHYATFPVSLPEWCIRSSCPERACAVCGAPWAPVVEREKTVPEARRGTESYRGGTLERGKQFTSSTPGYATDSRVLGYRATCTHGAEAIPGTVLDPFSGLGTTIIAALRLGRSAIGIELNPEYAEAARKRIIGDAPLLNAAALREEVP